MTSDINYLRVELPDEETAMEVHRLVDALTIDHCDIDWVMQPKRESHLRPPPAPKIWKRKK